MPITTKTKEDCEHCSHWVRITREHGACAAEINRMEAGHVVAFGDTIVRRECTCTTWAPKPREEVTFTRAEIRYAMREERIIDVPDGLFDLIFRE